MTTPSKEKFDFLQKVEEVNQLRAQLKELTVKCENQAVLLQAGDEKYKKLQERLSRETGVGGASIFARRDATREAVLAAQGRRRMEDALASLQSTNISLQDEIDTFQGVVEAHEKEKRQLLQHVLEVQKSQAKAEEKAKASAQETVAVRTQLSELRTEIATSQQNLLDTHERLAKLELEKQKWDELRAEKDQAVQQRRALREELMRVCRESSLRQSQLQNQLQQKTQFLEELKSEYKHFTRRSQLERDSLLREWEVTYQKLRSEFEEYRRRQHEYTQELHKEQHGLVNALQEQFEEYRGTVEHLFFREARQLEKKLRDQASRYEQQLQYVIRAKDQHFQSMVSAKDAKIMNLIEGTDYQQTLIQHQLDMEHLRRQHARQVDMVREAVLADSQGKMAELSREIAARKQENHQLRQKLTEAGNKQEQVVKKMQSQIDLILVEKERIHKQRQALEEQVDEAWKSMRQQHTEKEKYRHQVILLNLQLQGKADDSVESMLRRLTKETKELHSDLNRLSTLHKAKTRENEQLVRSSVKQTKALGILSRELTKRTEAVDQLTNTFEAHLRGRLKHELSSAAARSGMGMSGTRTTSSSRRRSSLPSSMPPELVEELLKAFPSLPEVVGGGERKGAPAHGAHHHFHTGPAWADSGRRVASAPGGGDQTPADDHSATSSLYQELNDVSPAPEQQYLNVRHASAGKQLVRSDASRENSAGSNRVRRKNRSAEHCSRSTAVASTEDAKTVQDRSQRLFDLIKTMQVSGSAKGRAEEAQLGVAGREDESGDVLENMPIAATSANVEFPPEQHAAEEKHSGGRGKRGPGVRYRLPTKLRQMRRMPQNSPFLQLGEIQRLEIGFERLQRFKKKTLAFRKQTQGRVLERAVATGNPYDLLHGHGLRGEGDTGDDGTISGKDDSQRRSSNSTASLLTQRSGGTLEAEAKHAAPSSRNAARLYGSRGSSSRRR